MSIVNIYFKADESERVRVSDDFQKVAGAFTAKGVHILRGLGNKKVAIDFDKVTHVTEAR